MKNEKCTMILEAKRSRGPLSKLPWPPEPEKKKRGEISSLFLLLFKFLLGFGTQGMSKHVCEMLDEDCQFPHVVGYKPFDLLWTPSQID